MDIVTFKEEGMRLFFSTFDGKMYECFEDQTRSEVDKEWLINQIESNRKNNFKGVVISEAQIPHSTESLKELYRHYGIIEMKENF